MNFDTNLKLIDGVGPKIASKLSKLGLEIVSDLIYYYPRKYEDYTKPLPIGSIGRRSNEILTIKGRIIDVSNKKTRKRNFTITEAVVEDGTGSIKLIWFNQAFLAKMLQPGREMIFNGKVSYNFFSKEIVMESPNWSSKPQIVPIYGETAGISTFFISKLQSKVYPLLSEIEDYLPEDVLLKHKLFSLKEALQNIHFPKSSQALSEARRRIAFDELFIISLRSNFSKEEIKSEKGPEIAVSDEDIDAFIKTLPFKLTGDQQNSALEIVKDLRKGVPMNRLLNGDVGSGKTVVAAIASMVVVKAGYRVTVMCPTSILAMQHYKTFCKLFAKSEISVGLYTRERKESSNPKIEALNSKQVPKSKSQKSKKTADCLPLAADIIVGTQALIQKDVKIENLGLVVVDEQHRFGVKQRAALQQLISPQQAAGSRQQTANSQLPTANLVRSHFLSMTATPIPRTMHLALFGDLDFSVIREKPADRKEVKTRFVSEINREKAYQFIERQIEAGRQAFVICPLIEDKSNSNIENLNSKQITNSNIQITNLFEDERKTVKEEYEKLQKIFPKFAIGMLHGKMLAKEKDSVMADFCANKLNIIVSTSVVEVGVDVPNASVMMIEDAERFGLAQIHQFRGRVGRGEHQSFCFLFSSTRSQKALERLNSLEAISDGFRLAEVDLETRGPGSVFGTEQSGMLDLKMASFSDRDLILEAAEAAKSVIENDPKLMKYPLLKKKMLEYLENKHLE